MKRAAFLAQSDVAGFIDWLLVRLPELQFSLRILPSSKVPGGLHADCKGIERVLDHYKWKSSWIDSRQQGRQVISQGWEETRDSLRCLRDWIRTAIASGDEDAVLAACLGILRWGGVSGAVPFLNKLHSRKGLGSYLQGMVPLLALDGEQSLDDLDTTSVRRFDAGLTKIHSLLDVSGSPIYDSRVGAAIAMLYALYRQQSPVGMKAFLAFPSGGARGQQLRNPKYFGFSSAPQFFTAAVQSQDWAGWQLRLGWILRSVLERCDWFAEEGDLAARCHAFEACLFMIGYDLRCFGFAAVGDARLESVEREEQKDEPEPKARGWVPAGHPFSELIHSYLLFRRQGGDDTRSAFQTWLVDVKGHTKSTANSYCFPFGENEFSLFGCDIEQLERIATGGEEALYVALGSREPYASNMDGDEREHICLVDVWLTGRVMELATSAKERKELLVNASMAGTTGSAATLISVGRNVGRHFGLLDSENHPTPFYRRFFGDALTDLDDALCTLVA
jgi:hypothetical protein